LIVVGLFAPPEHYFAQVLPLHFLGSLCETSPGGGAKQGLATHLPSAARQVGRPVGQRFIKLPTVHLEQILPPPFVHELNSTGLERCQNE
jgi:hypothetical protein